MSRFLSHLAELQPEMFAEISPELASDLKINNGDFVCIVTLRAAIEARALVSRRIRLLHINGKTVHQVAVPYHYGTAGLVRGGAANDLLTISGEPNVTIMEAKALTCNIVPGRLPRGAAFAEFLNKYAPQTTSAILHPEEPPPGGTTSGGGLAMEGKE
jgi:formate dehydrogenase major subunit